VVQIFTVLRFVAGAVGARINRLMIVQIAGLALLSGLLTERLIGPLLEAVENSLWFRITALLCVTLVLISSSAVLHRTLLPSAMGYLRRQPLQSMHLGLAILPWAMILAWPFAVISWLANPQQTLAIATAWLAGAILVVSLVGGSWRLQALAIFCGSLTIVILMAVTPGIAPVLLLPLLLLTPALMGSHIRTSTFARQRLSVFRVRTDRGILQALLRLDIQVLLLSWRQWLSSILYPLAGAAYLVVIVLNGNCLSECQRNGSLIVVSLAVLSSTALLASLTANWGARIIAPERVVPTRLRLASLFLVAALPPALIALALQPLSIHFVAFMQVGIVAGIALLISLWNPDRASEVGLVALFLFPWVAVILMLDGWIRPAVMLALLLILAVAIHWRGKRLRLRLQSAWHGLKY